MPSTLRLLPLLALPLIIIGCSSAPYANETTARSLGQGNWSTQLGATGSTSGLGGVYARQGYGATQNWDIGIDAETTSRQAGVWTRYSFINQPENTSLALIGGMGYGSDGASDHVYNAYAGPILSYKFNRIFEVYTLARVNYISRFTEDDENTNDINFDHDYVYGSSALGANIWINEHIGLTADANILFDDDSASEPYANAGIIFRY